MCSVGLIRNQMKSDKILAMLCFGIMTYHDYHDLLCFSRVIINRFFRTKSANSASRAALHERKLPIVQRIHLRKSRPPCVNGINGHDKLQRKHVNISDFRHMYYIISSYITQACAKTSLNQVFSTTNLIPKVCPWFFFFFLWPFWSTSTSSHRNCATVSVSKRPSEKRRAIPVELIDWCPVEKKQNSQ